MAVFLGEEFYSNLSRKLDAYASARALGGSRAAASRVWRFLNWAGQNCSSTDVARKLAGEGRFGEALSLLLAGTKAGGVLGRQAAEEFQTFATWLGYSGHVKEAEAWMGRLPDQSLSGAGAWFVDFWYRRSILDSAHNFRLRQLLGQQPDEATESKILWLLYMTGEVQGDLDQLYSAAARRGNMTAARDWLSILAARDPDKFFSIATDNKKWFAKKGTSLAIDMLLCDGDTPLANMIGERPRQLARHFRQSSADIWSRIGDSSLSVAVVGNSPCEIGKAKGEEIDAHDVVIRFNHATVGAQHQSDYGRKTDVLVTNAFMLRNFVEDLDIPVIVTSKDWEVFTKEKKTAFALAEKGVPLATVPRELRTKINHALKATASSGLQTLAAVCDVRGGNENVGIYGFSLVDQIGPKPTSANYFRNTRPAANHNWRGEALMLDAIRRNGNIDTALEAAGEMRYDNQWKTLERFTPTRFRIEGDHTQYHCGSAAVARSLRHFLAPHGVIVEDKKYDVLVVNGEGTMHHGSKGFHRKMKILGRALDAGKEAYLINTVWQDNPHDYDDVLRGLTGIIVREAMSQRELLEKHGIKARLHPDMAYYAPLEAPTDVVDYKGSIVITDFFSKEFDTFVRLTRAEAIKYPFVDMMTVGWDDLIASLKTAEMLITGRHHAVFAACRAEIPFVAFGGNTHKIEGIFHSAGVDIPICESRAKLPEMIEWARNNRQEYQKLFDWLKSYKGWKL
ncbi:glycosyltransferase family 29 protein [Rhizobium sp. KVB221]|uniref:Glycosyltransferase family 29 protein n=1 Tax=Rhizobium setariae TaxID=2801340 RepID=A0A936YWV3_9HYPH|nr:glycosyltransferase family 29 protein [Rhizobium setariae]MBL0375090.1 glycosyltransferase family 29 protein [Rhizobium setariae]